VAEKQEKNKGGGQEAVEYEVRDLTLSVGDTIVISTRFKLPEEANDVLRALDDGAFVFDSRRGIDIPAARYSVTRSGTFSLVSNDGSQTIRVIIERPINTQCQVIV
jgi:hypothetical protein